MSPYKSEDIDEGVPSLVEIQDALSSALSDLEAWARAGPEGMTSEERERFENYERVLERLTGGGPGTSDDVEEGGDE